MLQKSKMAVNEKRIWNLFMELLSMNNYAFWAMESSINPPENMYNSQHY